jgi:hypothetical protein
LKLFTKFQQFKEMIIIFKVWVLRNKVWAINLYIKSKMLFMV